MLLSNHSGLWLGAGFFLILICFFVMIFCLFSHHLGIQQVLCLLLQENYLSGLPCCFFQKLDPLNRLELEDRRRRPQGEMWRKRKGLTGLQWDSLGQEGGARVCPGDSSLVAWEGVGRSWRNNQGLYWITRPQPDIQNLTRSFLHGSKHSMKGVERRNMGA